MEQESLLRPASASNMASDHQNYGTLATGGSNGTKSLSKLQDTESSREEDGSLHSQLDDEHTRLRRELSARQVSMIAIGGAIGTGLFLGTGRSLAAAGPGTMIICYSITGFIVYITLLLLGEMATQYPVAGSFTSYATRFVDDAFGFALTWNYWFNDAVSVASDLTAAQLVVGFWDSKIPGWALSLLILFFLLGANAIHVKVYGELEYWLSSIKIVTIIVFIITGAIVNTGINREHQYIGWVNWTIGDAPFVGGIEGWATVFVTSAMSYGGTESLAITAGETRDPTRTVPRTVRLVFWRILIFYLLTCFIIGLNVPYTYPNLSNKSTTTSPFTIIFSMAGSNIAASAMNTVILTSVLSAGNHALFAGTRILYSLAKSSQAPRVFARTSLRGVPWLALVATGSGSALCFASSYVGSGQLWYWLQNLVGVSNQLAWLSIGLASLRFRRAWTLQGNSLDDLLWHPKWTRFWGPPFVIFAVVAIWGVQTYSAVAPHFGIVDFLSLYLQLPVFLVLFAGWKLFRRSKFVDLKTVDLAADVYIPDEETRAALDAAEELRNERLQGWRGIGWRLYYWIA